MYIYVCTYVYIYSLSRSSWDDNNLRSTCIVLETWLIHMGDVSHFHMRDDSFIYET